MKEYTGPGALSALSGIVKTALTGKQDKLTPGDGMALDGGAVSVVTPVRRILSQEEYDALPEAERGKGLYVVDDGQGGGVTMEQVQEAIDAAIGAAIKEAY